MFKDTIFKIHAFYKGNLSIVTVGGISWLQLMKKQTLIIHYTVLYVKGTVFCFDTGHFEVWNHPVEINRGNNHSLYSPFPRMVPRNNRKGTFQLGVAFTVQMDRAIIVKGRIGE